MGTISDFAQNCTKCALVGAMKNPQVSDQNSQQFRFYGFLDCKGHNSFLPSCVHFEGCLEAHKFIFVQDIGLKIGTLHSSGLLFLNLLSDLS